MYHVQNLYPRIGVVKTVTGEKSPGPFLTFSREIRNLSLKFKIFNPFLKNPFFDFRNLF